jgi:TolB protein
MRYIYLLFAPIFLFCEELEVHLATSSNLKPVYLSQVHTDPNDYDWRYFDELRTVLEYDLNCSGSGTVLSMRQNLEETIQFTEIRPKIEIDKWKKERIPYVLAVQVFEKRFIVTAFNTENATSKKYVGFEVTGDLDQDRQAVHRLNDAIQKDLFGREGIASLRIIYAQRERNSSARGLDWISEIWVSDYDGANARQITNERGYCLSPSFFTHSEFLYVSQKNGQSKICKATLDHPKPEEMVTLRGNQALPSLTQKKTQMAFITDVAGRPDLFIQNFDSRGKVLGKARQLYSCPRATQASPTYSPDGKRLAFVSDKDGPPRVYVIDVVGAKDTIRPHPKLLTVKNRENTSPSWSPDGTKLAYSAKVDGVRQIWIYDFKTQEEKQLTTTPENKENATWAPDSFHLVYNTETEDSSELYLVHLNQCEPILISKSSGQKRFASWEHR